ncbi:MAG TPA: alpha/beta fold hydrolase [Acidimicrobiales bacterium]
MASTLPLLDSVHETTIAGLNGVRLGDGPPLLLLHGIGHRWQAWMPVLEGLARDFEVVAIDLPGFGLSPPLTPPVTLAVGVERLAEGLDALGWDRAHVAGNSLGGWLAFELGRLGRARSICGLAPAGLWRDAAATEKRLRRLFAVWVGGARRAGPAVGLMRFRAFRTLALYGLFGRPWRIPAEIAIGDARALAASAFEETFAAGVGQRFTGGTAIDVPVTVAWCSRDPLFQPERSTLEELPPHTRVVMLSGCGHVPMWDDPELIVETIRSTAHATVAAG